MKPSRVIKAISLTLLCLLLLATPALADDFAEAPPIIATVTTEVSVLFDGLLDRWVIGNDLTSAGEELVSALGETAINTADFMGQQDFDQLSPLVGNLVSKPPVLIEGILNYWVTGNTLTEPAGEQIVRALAYTVVNTVHFLASLITMF